MSKQTKHVYEFGPFRLDTVNRLLERDGEPVPLKQKAVETLLALVEGRGEVLEKEALMQRLWPDSFVEEANLTQNIYTLRKALGAGDYIETIPRRGYRFRADVREWVEDGEDLVVSERTRSSILIEEEEETKEQAASQTEGLTLPEAKTASRTKTFVFAAVVCALAVVGLVSFAGYRRSRAGDKTVEAAGAPRSIAVLPFKSLTPEGGDDYLGLGMADTLITKLSGAGSLVVRPTSAVVAYAGKDSIEAGKELGVDYVLEGSTQRQGDRLRVTARLVRASDGTPVWADKFDECVADIFELQDTISEKVTNSLAVKLSGDERRLLTRRYTTNADAYQAYLKGRYFWDKRTEDGLKKSIEYFQQAVSLDPNFALAYSGLADAYIQLPGYGPTASMEVYPKAKAAAAQALELDDTLAEAHNSTAGVLSYFEWDWRAAEAEYRRALALNPNFAAAHQRLGVQLAATGRPDEALAEMKRARELDPLSLIINTLLGFTYTQAHQHDEAIAQLRRTIEMDANFPPAHEILAHVYQEKGMSEEAFAEYVEWRRLSGDGDEMIDAYRKAYAASGLKGFYRRRLDFLLEQSSRARVQPTDVARLYALLGEKEQALAWLEKAVEQHEGETIWLKTMPDYETLRDDPRFLNLLKRVNLDG